MDGDERLPGLILPTDKSNTAVGDQALDKHGRQRHRLAPSEHEALERVRHRRAAALFLGRPTPQRSRASAVDAARMATLRTSAGQGLTTRPSVLRSFPVPARGATCRRPVARARASTGWRWCGSRSRGAAGRRGRLCGVGQSGPASITATEAPRSARTVARMVAAVVFPAPPLGEENAITGMRRACQKVIK